MHLIGHWTPIPIDISSLQIAECLLQLLPALLYLFKTAGHIDVRHVTCCQAFLQPSHVGYLCESVRRIIKARFFPSVSVNKVTYQLRLYALEDTRFLVLIRLQF